MRDRRARWPEVIQMLLEGKPKLRIAEEMGMHRDTIHKWTKEPDFQRMFETAAHESRGPAWQLLRGLAGKAVETLGAGMHSEDERIRVACATEILDRVGIVKGAKLEVDTTQAAESLEELRDRWDALPESVRAVVLASPQGEQDG